jgi:hypothetical protein
MLLRLHNATEPTTFFLMYGVGSDGYIFIFITITYGRTAKISRIFDIKQGKMLKMLGCLRYILEMTAEMNPNVMPERDG